MESREESRLGEVLTVLKTSQLPSGQMKAAVRRAVELAMLGTDALQCNGILALHEQTMVAGRAALGKVGPQQMKAAVRASGDLQLARRFERQARARHATAHPDVTLPNDVANALEHADDKAKAPRQLKKQYSDASTSASDDAAEAGECTAPPATGCYWWQWRPWVRTKRPNSERGFLVILANVMLPLWAWVSWASWKGRYKAWKMKTAAGIMSVGELLRTPALPPLWPWMSGAPRWGTSAARKMRSMKRTKTSILTAGSMCVVAMMICMLAGGSNLWPANPAKQWEGDLQIHGLHREASHIAQVTEMAAAETILEASQIAQATEEAAEDTADTWSEEEINDLFAENDVNHDGCTSRLELATVQGVNFTTDWESMDENNDGLLSYDKFVDSQFEGEAQLTA